MKYKISKNIAFSKLDGEVCLFHSSTSEYLIINKVGTFIWDLLKEEISFNEIIENLVRKYDVDKEDSINALKKFLNKGIKLGIIQEIDIYD